MSSLPTADGFQNIAAGMGIGARNLESQSTYQFQYWTRIRGLLEAMYRGSWVVNKAVNIPADDMTRAGIEITWPKKPDAPALINRAFKRLHVWSRINSGTRWGRLYGGAIGVLMIQGQNVSTELRPDTIGKKSFRGVHIVDRWMITPSAEIVTDLGIHFGKPVSYTIITGQGIPFSGQVVHHTRVIRFEGMELPYYQKYAENGWGLSIIEPMYDRMVAFDTATAGTANLIHKAHLRILRVKDLRQAVAQGGTGPGSPLAGVIAYLNNIRLMQSSEGLTVLDMEDEYESFQTTFSGLAEVINSFAQQLCGAVDIPMTRFFGDSPKGMNATGDSDLRNYYDATSQNQESSLRDPLSSIIECVAMSEGLGMPPDDMDFTFNPLWQLSDSEKADIAAKDTATILSVREASLVSDRTALRELQASSRTTNLWSSITDDDVDAADEEIPPPPEQDGPSADPSGGKPRSYWNTEIQASSLQPK